MKKDGIKLRILKGRMKHAGNFSRFSVAYTKAFLQKSRIRVKLKNLMNPWVTIAIAKSSKKKKKL